MTYVGWVCAILGGVTLLLRAFRSQIYDRVIVNMTTQWYTAAMDAMPPNSRVLDVGIGTGAALLRCADKARAQGLVFEGLDYDADYVASCKAAFARAKAGDVLEEAYEASVYDFTGGPYDAAYFSGSLMIMPDKPGALAHVASLLRPGGRIYVTQTIEKHPNKLLEIVKPILFHITTIDFGGVTYLPDLHKAVADANLHIVDSVELPGGSSARAAHLFILE